MKRAPTLPPDREHLDPATAHEPDGAASAVPDGARARSPRGHDYEVGYARPPKAKQWTAGQSGNPRGRPKKAIKAEDLLFHILNERVTLTIAGEKKRVTRDEARLWALMNRGLKGDMAALAEFDRQRRLFPSAAPDKDVGDGARSLGRLSDLLPHLARPEASDDD